MFGNARSPNRSSPTCCPLTKIDVMYLYTDLAMEYLGGVSDTQMQTNIATALATTNEAMTNSEIDLEISPVYIGSVRSPNSSDQFLSGKR